MKNRKCIVYVDGGICSQICQYMIGYQLMQQGFDVEFDLSWYILDGRDLNGKKNRKFDLLKLCPSLKMKRASYTKSIFYKKFYSLKDTELDFTKFNTRNYLGEYYALSCNQYRNMKNVLHINPIINDENKKILDEIRNRNNTVGVHVRRGDMAKPGGYWQVISAEYYLKAMKMFPNMTFYFFSDDVQWVKENIISKVPEYSCEIVNCNTDDNGYLDLNLLRYCRNYICSSGSLGKIACILSDYENKRIVLPRGEHKIWREVFENQYILL